MPCYGPLTAYYAKEVNPTGRRSLVFDQRASHSGVPIRLPCGQCIGCRLERSRQWAVRCLHENKCHDESCFLTLTYDDDNLPEMGSLVKRDLQLFMKRMRKARSDTLRFFACGEYGETTDRPHYHVLLFGTNFGDRRAYKRSKSGEQLYTSAELESLWPAGLSSIGAVSFESAAYVARYVLKKVSGPLADGHYAGREPEFVNMSRRPGIGAPWLSRFGSEVYKSDSVIVRGVEARPPRFYDNKYELVDPVRMQEIVKARRVTGKLFDPENASRRRRTREVVKTAQVGLYRRDVV